MTMRELDTAGAILRPKTESWPMRLVGLFLGPAFMRLWWTTYRLPFQKRVTIAYPDCVTEPLLHDGVIRHELHHVEQFKPWWGPACMILLASVLPLPLIFSGRWFVERKAYLEDIQRGRMSLDHAVDLLWYSYGFAWPRPLMRRWFASQLQAHKNLAAA